MAEAKKGAHALVVDVGADETYEEAVARMGKAETTEVDPYVGRHPDADPDALDGAAGEPIDDEPVEGELVAGPDDDDDQEELAEGEEGEPISSFVQVEIDPGPSAEDAAGEALGLGDARGEPATGKPVMDEIKREPFDVPEDEEGPAIMSLDALEESPTNPRRTFPDEKELVASVKQHGVLQPLLVRPVQKDRFQIVAGHRRYRAAKKAGLREVPVVIRNMRDVQVIELQLTENLQRSDLHPMEEAEGYQRLHETHGYSVEKIAEKVNKSRAYIYARLKLIELVEPARKLFYAGKLNPSTALLVARIPDAKLQAEAAREITGGADEDDEPLSYRAAFEHIQDKYMLRLSGAPFSTKDEFLYPEMGACTKCPYRTGNAPDLFGDVGRTDVCTLPRCYNQKVQNHWANVAAKAQTSGKDVLTLEEGQKLYRYGTLPWDSKFVELNQICHEDKDRRTWKALLGDACPPVVVAPDLQFLPHELVYRSDAMEALKSTGQAKLTKAIERPEREKVEAGTDKLDRELRERTAIDILGQLVGKVEKQGLTPHVLRAMCFALLDVGLTSSRAIKTRRGVETDAGLRQLAERKLEGKQLLGYLFELCMVDWLEVEMPPAGYGPELKAMSKAFGLDLKGTEHRVHEQLKLEAAKLEAERVFEKKDDAKAEEPKAGKAKRGRKKRAA